MGSGLNLQLAQKDGLVNKCTAIKKKCLKCVPLQCLMPLVGWMLEIACSMQKTAALAIYRGFFRETCPSVE